MGVMGTVSLPFLGMVIVVFTQVTNMIVSKMAMSNGLSSFVLVLYSNAISAVILLPLSLLFHRSLSLFVFHSFMQLTLFMTFSFFYSGHFRQVSKASADLLHSLQILLARPDWVCKIQQFKLIYGILMWVLFWLEILDGNELPSGVPFWTERGLVTSASFCFADVLLKYLDMLVSSTVLLHLAQQCLTSFQPSPSYLPSFAGLAPVFKD